MADDFDLYQWRHAVASESGPASPVRRLVLLTLSLHMRRERLYAWPSQVTLAKRTGLSEKSVREHLHGGCADGWLRMSRRGLRGRGWVWQYTLQMPEEILGELAAAPWENEEGPERDTGPTSPEKPGSVNDGSKDRYLPDPGSVNDGSKDRYGLPENYQGNSSWNFQGERGALPHALLPKKKDGEKEYEFERRVAAAQAAYESGLLDEHLARVAKG